MTGDVTAAEDARDIGDLPAHRVPHAQYEARPGAEHVPAPPLTALPEEIPVAHPVEWLRPEFRGREDELITLSQGAVLAGVTRATVSSWRARYADFPQVALLTGSPKKRCKLIPRAEFWAFLERHRTRGRAKRSPSRPAEVINAERVAHFERQVHLLTAREQRQASALKATRTRLRAARRQLEQARTAPAPRPQGD